MNALISCVKSFGGVSKVSRALTAAGHPVTPQGVSAWCKRGRLPDSVVWAFCEAVGVPPFEIRPDLFPPPEAYWARTQRILDKKSAE